MNKTNKIIMPVVVAIVAVIGIGAYVYSIDAIAQITSLGQVANSIEKLYPQSTTVSEKLANVNGADLTTIAHSDQSETIDRSTGISKSKIESGRATLELQRGIQGGNDIVVATITNNSKDAIYLTSLIIFGQTSEGMEPLNAYVVDASYSPEVFGAIPKPTITKPVAIEPNQSYSGYISGKWSMLNQPIQSFSVSAVYVYDISAKTFVPGNNWSISVEES